MRFFRHILTPRLHLLWPVLTGVAAAYLLAGAVEYRAAPDNYPSSQVDAAFLSPQDDEPAWESLILEKNIMGLEIPSADPDPSPSEAETQASPTDWRLLGTHTGQQKLALVETGDGTRLVIKGEEEQGWELSEIEPWSTVWRSGPRSETLAMWVKGNGQEDAQASTERAGSPESRRDRGSGDSRRVTLSRQEARPFLENPNELLQQAHFEPYIENGEMRGFRINNIREDSMLKQVGLENGDVLSRIDGRSIRGPQDLMQAYSGMDRSSLVSMDVQRGGENVSFLVEID